MPPVPPTPMPGWVNDVDFAAHFLRYRREAGMTVAARVDLYKTLWAELELLRQIAHGGRAGGTVVTTSFQLVTSFARLHPNWEMNGDENQRRDCYWPRIRRRLMNLQAMGLIRYEIDQDQDLNDRRLKIQLLEQQPLTEADRHAALRLLERFRAVHGDALNTGSATEIVDVYEKAARMPYDERQRRAVAHGKAIYASRKKKRAGSAFDASANKTAHPSGGGPTSLTTFETPDHITTTATNTHTRLNGLPQPHPPAALNANHNPKNDSIEGGGPFAGGERGQLSMHLLAVAPTSSLSPAQPPSKAYRYWLFEPSKRTATYDLDAYNREVLAWLMGGRHGDAPHPGEPIVTDAPPCPNWPRALALYQQITTAAAAPLPAIVLGAFDDPSGRCQLSRYRFALAKWEQDGQQGPPPHPGHRVRSRRRDPDWHAAIEAYNMLSAVIAAPLSPTSRTEAAAAAANSLLERTELAGADERALREAWVTWRWGAQDLDARDLYGAGPALTTEQLEHLAHVERLYLTYIDSRAPGWPDTAVAALKHIAQARRRGDLEPADPDYPVGQIRLLTDGIRRLLQEARRMRSRSRAEDSDRVAGQVRRQLRGDQDRMEHSKTRFALKQPLRRHDPHATDTRWLRTQAEIRELINDREQQRHDAAASEPRHDNPNVALRSQLANLPPEILTDPDGLPVFDDWGRLVLRPEYLPEDDSPRETARVKVLRSRHRPVYLRLGFPLPPELDGALYQTLKATGQLPPPTDQPLTYEWKKFDLANDQARLHDELYEPQEPANDLYGEPRAPKRSIYDQGHEYRAALRQRLADGDETGS